MELETDLDLDPGLPHEVVEEIDEAFDASTAHVASIAGGKELSQDDKLALYGFYKQATEGPCTTFRPSFFDRVARAKWYNP
jgi:acyl-CoA-binding protein